MRDLFRICLVVLSLFVSTARAETYRYQESRYDYSLPPVQISPMLGWTSFPGDAGGALSNRYTLGAILELPFNRMFSLELEGIFGENEAPGLVGSSYLFGGGVNLKFVYRDFFLEPYFAFGPQLIIYDGVPVNGIVRDYWTLSLQAAIGLELTLTRWLSIGARGAFLFPLVHENSTEAVFGRVVPTHDSPVNAFHFRLLGNVSIAF